MQARLELSYSHRICTGKSLSPAVVCLVVLLVFSSPATATAEEFQYPLSVVVDKQETIFVADRKLPGIWKITQGKSEIFFQGSKKFRTPLNAIRCLALDNNGNLIAGDSSTREIYRFSKEGKPTPLTKGKIGIPMAIAVNSKGEIYVADLETRSIVIVPEKGGVPETFVTGLPVRGLAFDKQGFLLAAAHSSNQFLKIAPDKKIEVLTPGRPFQFSHHIAIDAQGNQYIADGYAKTIWKISSEDPNNKPTAFITDKKLNNPVGLAWHNKQLYIADPKAKSIFIFDQAGKLKSQIPKN